MRRVVVVGLGSMGRRRIRLASDLPDVVIAGVDTNASRRESAEKEFGIETYLALSDAVAGFAPNMAFVCTTPLVHKDVVVDCLKCGLHVFTEINLLHDWYDSAIALAMERGLKLFLSSTFLYRRETEYIAKAVDGQPVNYIYHSGQYLPDWHPWESYKDFFVSDKRTNACREILAIELPWLINAFGEIEKVSVMKGRLSSLDLSYNDNYVISLIHKSGSKGVFCQDVVSRKAIRRLEVYSEKLHLFWDGTPKSLFEFDIVERSLRTVDVYSSVEHNAKYADNIIENAYEEEISEFFDCVDGKALPRYSFNRDKKVLQLIDGIEGGLYG